MTTPDAPIELVEFTLGDSQYAIDIRLVREIVMMHTITPIPRAPSYISGVFNRRGEIIYLVNFNHIFEITDPELQKDQKIIVLVPGIIKDTNVGIVIDNVSNIIQVPPAKIEPYTDDNISSNILAFIKGIIKKIDEKLLIYIDMEKMLKTTLQTD